MVRRCVFSSRLANGHFLGPGSRSLLWVSDGARASAMRDVPRLPANTKNCFPQNRTSPVSGRPGAGVLLQALVMSARVVVVGPAGTLLPFCGGYPVGTAGGHIFGRAVAGTGQSPQNEPAIPPVCHHPNARARFRGASPVFSRTHT